MKRTNVYGILLGVAFFGQLVWGQLTTGTISGVVQDETGGVIPGVAVTASNVDTGVSRAARTDERGRYLFPSLPLGHYEVQAQMAGFQTGVRSGIVLTVGREANVGFTLKVGEVTQTVSVTGEAPLVDTTSASVGGTVDPEQVQNLPLNARSFEQLALLQPGVIFGKTGSSTGSLTRGRGIKVIIHGSRPDSNNYMMDGTDINAYSNQTPGSIGGNFLGVDAIREFRVETSSYSAQYGRNSGGVVNIVTKSGTNEIHGTVFHLLRNDNLDERNFFDTEKPEFRRNQFGFSLGGPVIRDKTFFFGNYEGLRESVGKTVFMTVPNLQMRNGFVPDRRTGQLQSIGVDPSVKPFLELYPLPNGQEFGGGTAERIDTLNEPKSENLYSARLDHNFSDSDSFFVRYTRAVADRAFAENVLFDVEDSSRNQYATLEQKHIVSPLLLNTFRMGFNRQFVTSQLAPQIDVSHLPDIIPGRKPFTGGGTNISGGGLSALSSRTTLPYRVVYESYQWVDDVFYSRGVHALKFGGVINWLRHNENEENAMAGDVSFDSAVEDFLLGRVNTFNAPSPGSSRYRVTRQMLFGWYIQDDMQVRPNLTLNLGLRHEFVTSPNEIHGRMSNLINLSDNEMTIGKLFTSHKDLFAPRVGFAWDPFKTGKTSFRGGFGVFYDQPLRKRWYSPLQNNPPFWESRQLRNVPFSQAYALVAAGAAQFEMRPITLQGTTTSMRFDMSIQQELSSGLVVSVGYSGAQGRHLPRRDSENLRVPVIRPDGSKFFPVGAPLRNPTWADVRRVSFDTNSTYSAMLTSVRKRFSGGLQFQASYTLAKALDSGTGIEGGESSASSFRRLDSYDWKRDKGLSDFDARHNLVLNSSYELPFGEGKNFLTARSIGWLVGGWQLNGILSLSSGTHFTVGMSGNRSRSSVSSERPDLRPGGNNSPVLGSPDRWFDTAEFQLTEAGTFGNLGRNTVLGPGLATLDLSIFRTFGVSKVSENFQIQFRGEFFNLFNKPNFDTPRSTVFDRLGRPDGTAGLVRPPTTTSSRQMQFGLRVNF